MNCILALPATLHVTGLDTARFTIDAARVARDDSRHAHAAAGA